MTTTNAPAVGVFAAERAPLAAKDIRKIILHQSKRAGVGHIGSALCVADILAALYGRVMNIPSPDHPDRDRFILSKGHAALALHASLFLRGYITQEELNSFCSDGSPVGVHPEHEVNGVDFATGSLGQGLSFGAGAALAAKMQKSNRKVFVLASDAECNEGSMWEAVMFAAHHKLSNLIAIIDDNAQQAFGYTKDVLNLSPLEQRWQAFGWDTHVVDGHDVNAIAKVIENLDTRVGAGEDPGAPRKPHVLIAKTTFGKGVSFMEGQIKWHYSPLSEEEYVKALLEVEVCA